VVEEDHLLLVGLGVVEVHQKEEEEVGDHYQGEVVEDHLKEEVVVGLQKEEEVEAGLLKVEEGPLLAVELQLVLVEVELQKEEQVEGLVLMLGLLIVEVKMSSDLLIMLPSILVSHHLQHSDLVRFQG